VACKHLKGEKKKEIHGSLQFLKGERKTRKRKGTNQRHGSRGERRRRLREKEKRRKREPLEKRGGAGWYREEEKKVRGLLTIPYVEKKEKKEGVSLVSIGTQKRKKGHFERVFPKKRPQKGKTQSKRSFFCHPKKGREDSSL